MKYVLSWLSQYCEWDWPVEELVERLTLSGTEVEAVHQTGFDLDFFVVARVASFIPHPNADRLRLCQIEDGESIRQVVCGAANFQEGDHVALALPGAVMPAGFKIKKSKLRGELSEGMLCSAGELGVPQPAGAGDGILVLDRKLPVGKPLRECFEKETVVECEVTPNRPDLLSYRGMARELVALGARQAENPLREFPAFESTHPGLTVSVEDEAACPRYTASVLEAVRVGESPAWMQKALEAAGLRPINNIVDITNYVLLETGQPLHAFDAETLDGSEIQVRSARSGEVLAALDGHTYSLTADDLVIADGTRPVALAGVMGGEATGVTEKTRRVILESARFQPSRVRATSRRLGLSSDSSYRFERGIDPAAVDLAAGRAESLIRELAGAQKVGASVQSSALDLKDVLVPLRPARAEQVLGFPIARDRIQEILERLGCSLVGDQWLIPSFRLDLGREADLIEEIARIEGLAKVEAALPPGAAAITRADDRYDLESELVSFLNGCGFTQAMTGSLVPEGDSPHRVRLSNPLVVDGAHLRESLLETLLPCVRHNLGRGNEDLALFEVGTVYAQSEKGFQESRQLLLLGTGKAGPLHWSVPAPDVDFYYLKGVVEALFERFEGLSGGEVDTQSAGLVPAELSKAAGIKVPVWFARIDCTEIRRPHNPTYRPSGEFPAVKRDLAFVLDRTTPAREVEKALQKQAPKELESVICFDVFTDDSGAKLPTDKKSLAYALTYRSTERTLKDKEVDRWDQDLVDSVRKSTGGTLRDT